MTTEEREEAARKNAEALQIAKQNANAKVQEAVDKGQQTTGTSNISGDISTQNVDQVNRQVTENQHTGTSSTVSAGSGISVSQQRGRSESYVQDNFTPEEQAEFNKRYVAAHPGYILNEKGEVVRDPKTALFDVLQVERDRLRDERERQEKMQRNRKLASGLANSAMLISDMISAGIGGNVYKRDKDKTGEEADKEIARLREQQIADDAAAKAQERAALDKWSADYWKAFNDWRKEKQRHISENSSAGNQQHQNVNEQVTNNSQRSVSKGTTSQTWGNDFRKHRYGNNYGGGRASGLTEIVKIPTGNKGTVDIHMPKGEYESTGRYLSALYSALSKSDGNNIEKVLKAANIKKQKDGSYDGAALLSSGIIFDDPKVLAEFQKAIQNDPLISYVDKNRIISEMKTYPTKGTKEEKRKWYQKIADWFKGKEPQGAGANTRGKTKIEW